MPAEAVELGCMRAATLAVGLALTAGEAVAAPVEI
jgi:hypothetical protein